MTLVLRHCNKHYGKKHALKDFTFSFETGVCLVPTVRENPR